MILKVMVEWFTFLLCMWEVYGSNLGLETGCLLLTRVFMVFLSFQADAEIIP
jgi:hypothetical protein